MLLSLKNDHNSVALKLKVIKLKLVTVLLIIQK